MRKPTTPRPSCSTWPVSPRAFLHALWSGICGYFVGFAHLYPRYRKSLYLLAIAIPATLNGLYDSFAGVFYLVSLMIALGSVLALMTYLSKSNNFRERLKGDRQWALLLALWLCKS
jgi:RsiW-degrading membrane proteinase PrsW (M82 family)